MYKISCIETTFNSNLFRELFPDEVSENALGGLAFCLEQMEIHKLSYYSGLEKEWRKEDIYEAMKIRSEIFNNKERFANYVRLNEYGYYQRG